MKRTIRGFLYVFILSLVLIPRPAFALTLLDITKSTSIGTLKSYHEKIEFTGTVPLLSAHVDKFKMEREAQVGFSTTGYLCVVKGSPPKKEFDRDRLEKMAICSGSGPSTSTGSYWCTPRLARGTYYCAMINTGYHKRSTSYTLTIDCRTIGGNTETGPGSTDVASVMSECTSSAHEPDAKSNKEARIAVSLETKLIEIPAGRIPQVLVHISNTGRKSVTGLAIDLPRVGKVSPHQTSLPPGETVTQDIPLLPAEAGLYGYRVKVTCREGAVAEETVLVKGTGGSRDREYGPAPETIPPDEIHRLMPETILDAACREVEDRRDWGMFTRRYGTASPQNSILVTINKNYNIKEEMDKRTCERWLDGNREQINDSEIKRYDGYPVVVGTDDPGYWIVGGFWFSWFECQIQCTGQYSYMKYFDHVVRAILANLGHASPPAPDAGASEDDGGTGDNPVTLEFRGVAPRRLELAESRNIEFTVTVANSTWQGQAARDIVVTVTEPDGREIGRCAIGRLPNHEKKTIEINAFVEIGDGRGSRDLEMRATCANVEREAVQSIDVDAIRPSELTMTLKNPMIVIESEMEEPDCELYVRNDGDLESPELALQCFLDGTEYASKKRHLYRIDGNEEEEITDDLGDAIENLAKRYLEEARAVPLEGRVRVVLTEEESGSVVARDYVSFRLADSMRSRVSLKIVEPEKVIDYESDDLYDEEEFWYEEELYEDFSSTIPLGTPFGIGLRHEGIANAREVSVELLGPAGALAAYWEFPTLYSGFIRYECDVREEEVQRSPSDDAFLQDVSCAMGRNEFTAVLRQYGEIVSRTPLALDLRGCRVGMRVGVEHATFDCATGRFEDRIVGCEEVMCRFFSEYGLGSPFHIDLLHHGPVPFAGISVAIETMEGKPGVRLDIPEVRSKQLDEGFAVDARFPKGEALLRALGCREGENRYTVVLREANEVLGERQVCLTVVGDPSATLGQATDAPPSTIGQSSDAPPSTKKQSSATPPAKESGEKLNLLGRLVRAQKQQKRFLKQLFMSGATLDEYTIRLYAEGTPLYEKLNGGAAWNHKKREVRLFAGEEEETLTFGMAHELSHLITFDLAERLGYVDQNGYPGKVPIWYVEGIAEFGAIQWIMHADPGAYFVNRALLNFKADVKNGNSPIKTLNAVMNRKERKVHGFEYAAVGTFVEYIYNVYGGGKTLVSIWVDTAEHGDVREAIRIHTGSSLNTLKVDWEFYLQDAYDFHLP